MKFFGMVLKVAHEKKDQNDSIRRSMADYQDHRKKMSSHSKLASLSDSSYQVFVVSCPEIHPCRSGPLQSLDVLLNHHSRSLVWGSLE